MTVQNQALLYLFCVLIALASCQSQVSEMQFQSLQDSWYDSPSWSPNGEELLVHDLELRSGFQILRVRVEDGQIEGVVPKDKQTPGVIIPGDYTLLEYPVWSPVGGELAAVGIGPGGPAILAFDEDHSEQELIISLVDYNDISDLSWAPDGNRLAFAGHTGEGLRSLFVVNRNGTDLMQLEVDTPYQGEWDPAWSPNGNNLAFVSGLERQHWDIFVRNNNGQAINLTNTPQILESSPVWSPDSQWIAFATLRRGQEKEGAYGVASIRSDGTSRVQLIDGASLPYNDLAWSPDGQWLAASKQYYLDEVGHYSCTIVLIKVDSL